MKEIKFRGKSLDTGKWIYGYVAFTPDKSDAVIIHEQGHNLMQHSAVDPKTVSQFTGLYEGGVPDGREIYFGDRMRAPSGLILEVFWFEDEMRIALRDIGDNGGIYNFNVPLYNIAGNAIENPELV
jgi:hypothetical protein